MTDAYSLASEESVMKGERKDCAVKAVAIVTDYSYNDTHYAFELCGRQFGKPTRWDVTTKTIEALKCKIYDVTDEFKSRTILTLGREMKWRRGKYLVRTRHHLLAIVDGKVHDWTSGRRHRVCRIYRVYEGNNNV